MGGQCEITAFVGHAGVGKTYRLIKEVLAFARSHSWTQWETILGLSFMHGARRRLVARLQELRAQGYRARCETIDGFALNLVRRFRQRLGLNQGYICISEDLDGKCRDWTWDGARWLGSLALARHDAAKLLSSLEVQACIRAAHPVVIVDEFQDCDSGLVNVVQGLANATRVFIAADDFQDLRRGVTTCEAVEWLTKNARVTELKEVHRTDVPTLLNSADALRTGEVRTGCVDIQRVDAPGLAAWKIMELFAWQGWQPSKTVLLSPLRPTTSPFVRNVLGSLQKELGRRKRLGPYPFRWAESEEERLDSLKQMLPPDDSGVIGLNELRCWQYKDDPLVSQVCRRAVRLCGVRGVTHIKKDELAELADQCMRSAIAYGSGMHLAGQIGMTIHAAKNREFENVIILWPAGVADDTLNNRRLLYNAVTRARKRAIIILQGGKTIRANEQVLKLLK